MSKYQNICDFITNAIYENKDGNKKQVEKNLLEALKELKSSEIDKLVTKLDNYDDIYEYANTIVNEVGYTGMAMDHDLGMDRLTKEYPTVKRSELLEILLFAEGD